MIAIITKGFMVAMSLIVAIGAQNTFVLKQALKQEYVFPTIFTCFLIDVVLMSAGVFGVGYIIEQNPLFIEIIVISGMIFLSFYACMCLYSAFKGNYLQEYDSKSTTSLKQTMILLLSINIFNPHLYLDTLLLIGGIGGVYTNTEDKIYFLVGALFASAVWFTLLGYGSKFLIPLFKKKITWRVLDTLIAIIMFYIAYPISKYL